MPAVGQVSATNKDFDSLPATGEPLKGFKLREGML